MGTWIEDSFKAYLQKAHKNLVLFSDVPNLFNLFNAVNVFNDVDNVDE